MIVTGSVIPLLVASLLWTVTVTAYRDNYQPLQYSSPTASKSYPTNSISYKFHLFGGLNVWEIRTTSDHFYAKAKVRLLHELRRDTNRIHDTSLAELLAIKTIEYKEKFQGELSADVILVIYSLFLNYWKVPYSVYSSEENGEYQWRDAWIRSRLQLLTKILLEEGFDESMLEMIRIISNDSEKAIRSVQIIAILDVCLKDYLSTGLYEELFLLHSDLPIDNNLSDVSFRKEVTLNLVSQLPTDKQDKIEVDYNSGSISWSSTT